MKIHQLIDGEARALISKASYGPDTLKAMGQAFEEAWLDIAGNYSFAATECARFQLANVLLSVASEGCNDVNALKRYALELMARRYPLYTTPTIAAPAPRAAPTLGRRSPNGVRFDFRHGYRGGSQHRS